MNPAGVCVFPVRREEAGSGWLGSEHRRWDGSGAAAGSGLQSPADAALAPHHRQPAVTNRQS